jgi:hypothetical protein
MFLIEEVRPTPQEAVKTYQFHQYSGSEHWVLKEMVSQDLIIKQDVGGIWINN